ncbi:MAG: YheU family protein [Gammaproteobacteria bacterium]|nr:MAG: YheU family protein [Gammaproteobacteria bacterium]RLA59857.1 MAG: YheU family protein [Gammaproteobacteria bacterium]
MAEFVAVPLRRLQGDILQALLEEFASRDGTDYGECEVTLVQKTTALHAQLAKGELQILYDADSEQWDLVSAEQAATLLNN